MQERSLSYLDRLKHNVYKILAFIVIIYGACIMLLYQSYQDKAEIEKAQILQDYYNKIVKVSTDKINFLTGQLSSNLQSQNLSINTNATDIEICSDKCINYNLFRFGALIDQYIPEFIYYKIELNKKFLYSNIKIQNYQIEKIYHLNDYNQFSISLTIDKSYWSKVEADIKKPFWIITLFATVNILLLYILSKISFKSFNKEYTLHYQNKYKEELDQLKFNHKEELKSRESFLMKKIWNNDYSKQKDIEVNCLFAQEANRIAFFEKYTGDEGALKDYKLQNFNDNIPCSIVLYKKGIKERINLIRLSEVFTERFSTEDEKLLINLPSPGKVLIFTSQAALYQIIYSIVSYLFFLLKKQYPASNHQINLTIEVIDKKLKLLFEYEGIPTENKQELFKTS